MLSFTLRRLLSGVALILVISFVAFALLYADSAGIARQILGHTATEEVVERKTVELGLDRSLWEQYSDWFASALGGDFGRSWFTSETVAVALASRLGVTMSLVVGTTLIAALAAVGLGVLAARRGGWVDAVVQSAALIGFAVPGFLIALYLVLFFAVQLGWFRATGYIPPTESLTGWLSTIILPVVALSLSVVAAVAQQIRGSVLDAMSRDYVRTLRARGLSERSVVYRHVLRNAGGPALAVLALQMVGLLGGTVIIEQVFALPGMGQLAVQATTQGDIPVVMGIVIAFAVIVVVINFAVDLAQAALNPKVRLA